MPLIVFEGVDGCGKSTQARRLATTLRQSGSTVVELREPGGSELGERLRSLLLDPATKAAPTAELFCYLAARAQLCAEVIAPALAAQHWVILDRFWFSTIAYQCHGLGVPEGPVRSAISLAIGGTTVQAAFWLDLPVEICARRRAATRGAADRIELRGLAYLEKVRTGYAALASAGELIRIDGSGDPDQIAAAIAAQLR
ncbi:thymidylate kinase [Planctomycetota bacterium]|nr:thymidylate kinase [Planctomycetota bacterium]